MEFAHGEAVAPLAVVGDANGQRGTEVTFLPSTQTFTMIEFDFATLEHRLRELAFLNSGVSIVLSDMRHAVEKREEMRYDGGIEAFVKYLDRNKTGIMPAPITIRAEQNGIGVECALWWNDSYHENVLCFTNNIPQRDGGTHLAGFRGALTRQVTGYAETSGISKKEKISLTGDDCREGLTAVLSVKVPDPKFSSQTKDKLVSSEVRPVVEGVINEAMQAWFEEHPSEAKMVVGKVIQAAAAREAARKARELDPQEPARRDLIAGQARRLPGEGPGEVRTVHRRGRLGRRLRQAGPQPRIPGGASACAEKSSTSSACSLDKDAVVGADRDADHRARRRHRNRRPKRGLHGRGVVHLDKLRYHKIIIMTDADVDGAHIRTLLLTFFFRQMPELIERGHLYIAQPPLYKVSRGKSEQYLKDERALEDYLIDTGP